VVSAYVVQVKYRKEIDSKCFKFIWNNKPDKVKRTTVIGKLGNGAFSNVEPAHRIIFSNLHLKARLV
jgi:hypothetical protein